MTVYGLDSSNGIAARLSRLLGDRYVMIETKTFPDGEVYIRVPEKPEGVAIAVVSTYAPQEKRLMQLLMTLEALGQWGTPIVAVIPYMAYARQDKRFLEGEPISARIVLSALESIGVDALVLVDVHQPHVVEEWFREPWRNVIPYKEVASYFRGILERPLVLAPDRGALERAKLVAGELGAPYDFLVKERDRVTGEVRVQPKSLSVEGRDVLIVDDIISTGGTMALAARNSLEAGARRVYAVCSHAVMVRGALDRLLAAGVEDVVATDTVPSPVSKISVAPSLAEAVKEVLGEIA